MGWFQIHTDQSRRKAKRQNSACLLALATAWGFLIHMICTKKIRRTETHHFADFTVVGINKTTLLA
jgi:hypothetical protein